MQKILLLSDTHSYIDDDIIKYVQQADVVWHAGDIGNIQVAESIQQYRPLIAVYGNIDGAEVRSEFPENQFFECEKVKIFMTHIGGYPGRYPKAIQEKIRAFSPHIFVCGHSHILKVMYDQKLKTLTMNPGAIGKNGFHQKRTMLRFEIEQDNIQNLEVIEFSR